MAETFRFELVSPVRLLMSEEVEQAVIPGTEGYLTVMAAHAPIMTTLRPGLVEAGDARFFVKGGFAEVTETGLTVLAESAIPVDELTASVIDEEIAAAEKEMAAAGDDHVRRSMAEERRDQYNSARWILPA